MTTLSTAHPRSRGENTEADEDSRALWGSSPLTRGKQIDWIQFICALRLIPAHAGKTRLLGSPHDGGPAHPRSRGENGTQGGVSHGVPGSSPLTRGKRNTSPERLRA